MGRSMLAALAAACSFFTSFADAFDINANTNLAVYYGQGSNQPRLRNFCQESSLDIIPIGFINVFPDQEGSGGYPGSNFGNQCSSDVYVNNGTVTKLNSDCHQIAEDIPICQAAGKVILLSIGGASTGYHIDSDESAHSFADFLWGAFGPRTEAWAEGPRPFGDAVVDGFDFDIEHGSDLGYGKMAERLRWHFTEDSSKRYYLSAAPQCLLPDKHLSTAIRNAQFDFIFVQFYNTPACSARQFIADNQSGTFTYDDWMTVVVSSANPSARLYLGLPASPSASSLSSYYLQPSEVQNMLSILMKRYPNFGGVMLWEATASENNQVNGMSYADIVKEALWSFGGGKPTTTTSSTVTSTTVSSTTTPTTPSTTPTITPTSPTSPTTSTPPTTPVTPITPSTTPTSTSTPTTLSTTTRTTISPSSPTGGRSTSTETTPTSRTPETPTNSPTTRTPGTQSPGTASHSGTNSASTSPISPGEKPTTLSSSSPPYPTTSNSTITSGPTAVATSTPHVTVTTVITTSYTSICPTGFTTITTTITTTYCPEETLTITPTSVPHGSSPSPPEGWTTIVTVCPVCAETPTTVTLTVPKETAPPRSSTTEVTVFPIPETETPVVGNGNGNYPSPRPTTLGTAPIPLVTSPGNSGACPGSSNCPPGNVSPIDNSPTTHNGGPAPTASVPEFTGSAHARLGVSYGMSLVMGLFVCGFAMYL